MKKPNILFLLLLVSAFTSGLRFDLSTQSTTITINISQILSLILVVYYFYKNINNKYKVKTNFEILDIAIILYLFSNIFSSLFFSSHVLQSLKSCLTISSYILIYFVTKKFTLNLQNETILIDILYILNIISMAIGVSFLLLSLSGVFPSNIGVNLLQLSSGFPSITSLSYEPNLFAMISAVMGSLSILSFLLKFNKYNNLVVLFLTIINILFSFTRTVYFSFPFSIGITTLFISRKRLKNLFLFGLVLLTGIVVYQVILSDNRNFAAVSDRLKGLFDFETSSGYTRLLSYEIAFKSFNNSPIWGNGTNTAPTEFVNKWTGKIENLSHSKGWLTGAWIQSLQDTGIVGFIIIAAIFISSIFMNYKAYKISECKARQTIFVWFIVGNLIIAITSQLSSSLFIAFPWIYWGINVAIIQKSRIQTRKQKVFVS